MPIYEYLCLDCNKTFDEIRPIRDADKPIECQDCLGDRTIRKVSVFFAQSGGKVLAGSKGGGCSGCSAGSCAGCSH